MSSKLFLLPNAASPATPRWSYLIHAWLPVFLFTGMVAVESTAAFGSDHTSRPLHSLIHFILGTAADRQWSIVHHFLRKTGHFAGYGLLSVACFRGFLLTLQKTHELLDQPVLRLMSHTLAISAVFALATADELHQTYLPNRTGCFSDVLLDTAGALALQLGLFLILRLLARRQFGFKQDSEFMPEMPLAA